MDKVWVVTSGEYSDYHIVRIFSTEEAANEYASTFSRTRYGQSATVDEWPLDSDFDRDSIYWEATFWRRNDYWGNGYTVERHEELPEGEVLNTFEKISDKYNWDTPHWRIWVQAPTEEQAFKIVQDKAAQYNAELAGIA